MKLPLNIFLSTYQRVTKTKHKSRFEYDSNLIKQPDRVTPRKNKTYLTKTTSDPDECPWKLFKAV